MNGQGTVLGIAVYHVFLSMRGCHFNRVRDDLLKPNKNTQATFYTKKRKEKGVTDLEVDSFTSKHHIQTSK